MDEWEVDVGKLAESTKRYEAHTEELETLRAEAEEYESKIAVRPHLLCCGLRLTLIYDFSALQLLQRRITILKDELARLYDKSEKKRITSKQRIKSLTEQHAVLYEQRRGLELAAESKMKQVTELEKEVRAAFVCPIARVERLTTLCRLCTFIQRRILRLTSMMLPYGA